jgi:hypothetical protein
MNAELITVNGIDASTGHYLLETSMSELAAVALGQVPDLRHLAEVRARLDAKEPHFGLAAGRDPKRLDQSGWGVIFPANADPQVRDALTPLLRYRQEQAGACYREFIGEGGWQPADTKASFLRRNGAAPGQPADPRRVPYYLMIVASPESVAYRFQYGLDLEYAVGRLDLESLDGYASYAQSVVATEMATHDAVSRAAFFGVRNSDDLATRLSADEFVAPLATYVASGRGWSVNTVIGDGATKARLTGMLGGAETPDFLLTATHGVGFRSNDPRQAAHQGALICQDWPGPLAHDGPITEEMYFSADDVLADARVRGLVVFHFACFSAGTPQVDAFARPGAPVHQIAPHAFVARLPQRLLGHSGGGALAVIGHVDRAWSSAFKWDRSGTQLQTFESMMALLLDGHPVGSAMEPFNQRYAALSADLALEIQDVRERGAIPDERTIATMWMLSNDARSYVVLGDPAVRLARPGSP